jgi:hypothetical protein
MKRDKNITALLKLFGLACLFSISTISMAKLRPLSDAAMSNEVAQAAIAVDYSNNGVDDFTRVTAGLNTDFQINTDNVVLGEIAKTGQTNNADFQATNLSFGHISTDSTKTELDGKQYAAGTIVPFEGIDPYFEVATESGQIVGFRMGFTDARGTLSGDIASMSGNIGMKIDDGSGTIKDAQLLDASGQPTNYRSSYIGLASATTDCTAKVSCNSLSAIKTLDIGSKQADGSVALAKDFFLSFQKQAVTWSTVGGTGTVSAASGLYVNIPTAMQLNMTQLQTGVAGQRTEYIDRGVGRF